MDSKWLQAILDEDQEQIQSLFDQHYKEVITQEEISFFLPCSCDGLMIAAFLNKQQSVRTLSYLRLSKKKNDFGVYEDVTALMLAASRDNFEIIDQLQFQINKKSKNGITALMICSIYNAYNVCSILAPYESGQIVVEETKYALKQQTALQLALKYKNREVVNVLLPWEVNINQNKVFQLLISNGYVNTPIMNQSPTIAIQLDTIISLNRVIQKHIQTLIQDPYLTPVTRNTIQLNNTLQLSAIQNAGQENEIINIVIEDDNQVNKQQNQNKKQRQHYNKQKNRYKNTEEINIIITDENDDKYSQDNQGQYKKKYYSKNQKQKRQ